MENIPMPVDISTLTPGDRFRFRKDGPLCTLVRFERGHEQDAEGWDEPGHELRWIDPDGKATAAWNAGEFTTFVYLP